MVDVGIPAKSGVSGVIMCVVPGVCGFAAFSPRLDANGNSTRGVLVASAASEILGLHVLHQGGGDGGTKAPKKASSGGASSPSNKRTSTLGANGSLSEAGAGGDAPGRRLPPLVRGQSVRGRSVRVEPAANYSGGSEASDSTRNEIRLAEDMA
mmetsp:Transcript_19117/g.65683  ORF Transcript_19117/g.65683 Transcript_19117/m.65683 type:complete len:153 (+) Transcript_19117:2-460(+)